LGSFIILADREYDLIYNNNFCKALKMGEKEKKCRVSGGEWGERKRMSVGCRVERE
jgi:hypothetical protein